MAVAKIMPRCDLVKHEAGCCIPGGMLKEELIAMVPLADFVNHPPDGVVEPNVSPFYDVATGSFRLTAVRDIKPNEAFSAC